MPGAKESKKSLTTTSRKNNANKDSREKRICLSSSKVNKAWPHPNINSNRTNNKILTKIKSIFKIKFKNLLKKNTKSTSTSFINFKKKINRKESKSKRRFRLISNCSKKFRKNPTRLLYLNPLPFQIKTSQKLLPKNLN